MFKSFKNEDETRGLEIGLMRDRVLVRISDADAIGTEIDLSPELAMELANQINKAVLFILAACDVSAEENSK